MKTKKQVQDVVSKVVTLKTDLQFAIVSIIAKNICYKFSIFPLTGVTIIYTMYTF